MPGLANVIDGVGVVAAPATGGAASPNTPSLLKSQVKLIGSPSGSELAVASSGTGMGGTPWEPMYGPPASACGQLFGGLVTMEQVAIEVCGPPSAIGLSSVTRSATGCDP